MTRTLQTVGATLQGLLVEKLQRKWGGTMIVLWRTLGVLSLAKFPFQFTGTSKMGHDRYLSLSLSFLHSYPKSSITTYNNTIYIYPLYNILKTLCRKLFNQGKKKKNVNLSQCMSMYFYYLEIIVMWKWVLYDR